MVLYRVSASYTCVETKRKQQEMSFLSPSNYNRVAAFVLGVAAAGTTALTTQTLFWSGTTEAVEIYGYKRAVKGTPEEDYQVWSAKTKAHIVRKWNSTIDSVGREMCAALASAGL